MDWRTWVYQRLINDVDITADVPAEQIFTGASLTGVPAARPFIVVTFGTNLAELHDGDMPSATSQRGVIQAHDDPGDYLRIDRILKNVRTLLAGATAGKNGGGIMGMWEGDSGDLSDDLFKTILRQGEYRFVGKVT